MQEVTLPENWTWVNGSTILSAGTAEYPARLAVDDTAYDYTEVKGYQAEGHYVERALSVAVKAEGSEPAAAPKSKKSAAKADVPAPYADGDIPIDEEHFPDETFREYLSTSTNPVIDKNGDKVLSSGEIASATYINVLFKKGIKSLKGLEYFTALKTLYCDGTGITELDISSNTALTDLSCSSIGITELNINSNTALTEVSCSITQIKELDITNNLNLKKLWCYKTNISQLDVSKNTNLEALYCHETNLDQLNVSKNTKLKILTCNQTGIDALDVSQNTALTQLACHTTNIKSLNVSKNLDLEELNCERTGIAGLDISQNTKLTTLNCNSTGIESLDISKNDKLAKLSCNSTKIKSLDVSKKPDLTELHCERTGITGLDVSQNTKLKELSCSNTPLAYLNMGDNPSLKTLQKSDSSSVELQEKSSSFKIQNKFPGIDPSKITVSKGATYDPATGLVSGYLDRTPIEYSYYCGTANNIPVTLNVKLTVIQKDASSIKINDVDLDKTYDGNPVTSAPSVEKKGSTGAVTYIWYKITTEGREKISSAPTDAGDYMVKAHLDADDDYAAADSTSVSFVIDKADSAIVLETISDKTYDGSPFNRTPAIQKKTGTGEVTYTWKMQNSIGTFDPIDGAPTDVGTYSVQAHIAEDVNYKKADSAVSEFSILRADNSWTSKLKINDRAYGPTANGPSATPKFGTVFYTYSDAPKGPFTKDAPTAVGTWYVKATVPETKNYTGLEDVAEFKITKASAPKITFPKKLRGVPGAPLSSVKLPEGWAWVNGDQTLTVHNSGYQARLTVDDSNYDYTGTAGYDAAGHYVEKTLSVTVANEGSAAKANTDQKTPPGKNGTAKTSDTSSMGLWAILMALAAGAAILLKGRRKKGIK